MMASIHQMVRPARIAGHERGIDRYMKELPEAEKVLTLQSSDLRERGWARLQRNVDDYGSDLPWPKTKTRFRLRPGEMTIWAGPNGSFKSATVNFILAHLAWNGERVFLASLELTVDDQMARLAKQMLGSAHPIRSRYDGLMDRLGDSLALYDFVGRVKPERAVALARYAATDLQAQHVLIDNLTMVVPPGKDSDGTAANFVAGLYQVGRDTGAHIHLIAHVRKPDDDGRILNRYDIRGTGAAPDVVDNCVLIQRNEAKRKAEDDFRMGRTQVNPKREDPDLWMNVDKQRHAPFSGRMGFWVYETNLRLAESGIDHPEPYL